MFVRYASMSTGGLEHVGTQQSHGILRHPTASYGTDFPMSTLCLHVFSERPLMGE